MTKSYEIKSKCCYVVLYVAHTWTVWPRRWMTNCRRPVWSALQNCVKTMTSQEMSCLRWVTPAYVDHIRALTRNYTVYNILVDNICIQTSPRLFADCLEYVSISLCSLCISGAVKASWQTYPRRDGPVQQGGHLYSSFCCSPQSQDTRALQRHHKVNIVQMKQVSDDKFVQLSLVNLSWNISTNNFDPKKHLGGEFLDVFAWDQMVTSCLTCSVGQHLSAAWSERLDFRSIFCTVRRHFFLIYFFIRCCNTTDKWETW